MSQTFAVDPGVAGTGYAVIERYTRADGDSTFTLRDAGNIYAPKHITSFEGKARHIVDKLEDIVMHFDNIEDILLEFPTYMPGRQVASSTDATIKMAYIVGMMDHMLHRNYGPVTVVIPTKWKGTMSKALVDRRVRKRILVPPTVKSHAIDAIGIGLWHLGQW